MVNVGAMATFKFWLIIDLRQLLQSLWLSYPSERLLSMPQVGRRRSDVDCRVINVCQ